MLWAQYVRRLALYTLINDFMKTNSLLNKDLALSDEPFTEAVTNDFIRTDFIDRLERNFVDGSK